VEPTPPPAAEVAVSPGLARALVAEQHPDLLAPVQPVAEGWDNLMVRLGPELAVRLPRRGLAAELVEREATWLPLLAPHLPVEVPVPVRRGHPSAELGYPFPWTVVRWVAGEAALTVRTPPDEGTLTDDLAGILLALGSRPAPTEAPRNPWRGVPLAERSEALLARIGALSADVDAAEIERSWVRALGCPPFDGPLCWVHGDLHPGNLVVRDGRLAGVVDWGDLTAGDPACDLAVAWMLLGPEARVRLREALGADDATWGRARGNALAHAVAVVAHSDGDPAMAAMGRRTLDAVLADDA